VSELRCFMSMSLDGFVAGPDQSAEDPLGVGGMRLPEWIFWGEDPPFHVPVFVLTHHGREPLEMKGDTTFNFVTDGIEAALERAKEAAGDADVSLAGGAKVVQQYLAAGLLDELDLSVVPVLLGDGERLFENLGADPPELTLVDVVDGPGVTHLRYRAAN
jgi:dihydrofolate reductase